MNHRARIQEIEAELDVQGIVVQLRVTPDGIVISSASEADRLLATAELKRQGMIVATRKPS